MKKNRAEYFSRPGAVTYILRLIVLIGGLMLFAVGKVLTYQAALGLAPWDVLHQGLSLHTPLTFGEASIASGLVLIALGMCMKIYPGLGTILNMLLIGVFADQLIRWQLLAHLSNSSWFVRLPVTVVGVFCMAMGTALYIVPHLGAGPRDGLMLRLHQLTKMRIALVRAAIECLACLTGFLLGGTVGIGTILFALGIGPALEMNFWLIARTQTLLKSGLAAARLRYGRIEASNLEPPHQESHPVDLRSS